MQPAPLSASMTVFIIFFGASVLDAFVTRSWWRAAFWMVIAAAFFAADRIGRKRQLYDRAGSNRSAP